MTADCNIEIQWDEKTYFGQKYNRLEHRQRVEKGQRRLWESALAVPGPISRF